LAELVLMLLLIPLAIVVVFALLDATGVLPGMLPPSSQGRQFLRWMGASPWRCVALIALAVALVWFWAR